MHKIYSKITPFNSITLILIFLFIFSINCFSQNLSFTQSFILSLLLNNNSYISLGAIENSNIIFSYKNQNFLFFSSFVFLKYEFKFSENLSYSYFFDYIWLRLPIMFFSIDFGIKPELDVDQISLDLFLPYNRLIFSNFISTNNSSNRWQLGLKFFISDFVLFNLKWYVDYNFNNNSKDIFLVNLFCFFEPIQLELVGIYYNYSDKYRFGFLLKFPFFFEFLISSALHLDSKFDYRYYEFKAQIGYTLPNLAFSFIWYFSSFVFNEEEFTNIFINQDQLLNLDELLIIDKNIFHFSLKYIPDPFSSFGINSLFTINNFSLLIIFFINFYFSNSLKLELSYITYYVDNNQSTIYQYWIKFLPEFSGILSFQISFSL